MSRKNKCERCKTVNQGFHLCWNPDEGQQLLGSVVAEKIKRTPSTVWTSQSASQSSTERWASHHEANSSRNQQMLEMYEEGYSLKEVGRRFGVEYHGTRSAILRLGGTIRPKGTNRHTTPSPNKEKTS